MRYFIWVSFLVLLCGACSGRIAATSFVPDTQTPIGTPTIFPIISLAPSPTPTPNETATVERDPLQATVAALDTQVIENEIALETADPGWPTITSTSISVTSIYTPTPSSIIYPTKQPLLLYFTHEGDHSIFDFYGLFFVTPRVLLYNDGQLLVGDKNGRLREKQLSKSEIDALFAKLHALGFFQVQSNNADDPSDPLYHFGPGQYQQPPTDETYTEIQVYGDDAHAIGINEGLKDYVIQPVKNILSYLNSYAPTSLTLYHPDRLLVAVGGGRAEGLGQVAAIPWPKGVPSPEDAATAGGILYLEGKPAGELYQLIKSFGPALFSFNHNEYTIMVMPIYPDECHTRVIDPGSINLPTYQQVFTCQN